MHRDRTSFLLDWLKASDRKPLIIRGARQVGKTWLIRNLANLSKKRLIELNFEKRPDFVSLFSSNDVREILFNVSTSFGGEIDPSNTILFLDEIQEAPQLLSKLRWFAEDIPQLAVIAAGSLLDFALDEHKFSMPVGRIGYLYLEPLSFEEFLEATSEKALRAYLQEFDWNKSIKIPESLHLQLLRRIKEYLIIGGMPAVVSSWINEGSPETIHRIQIDLITTFRDDFSKYSGRLSINRLEDIMSSVPRQLGHKFVYTEANSEATTPPLKQALQLLCQARVCHRIVATAANGLPLGAESNEKFSKIIMLDCGLCNTTLGLALNQLASITDISLINQGGVAEQLVGQLLRTITPAYIPPTLYYWERPNGKAEVDYVMQHENLVIPIEVKSGSSGSLKSLHQFMHEKKLKLAVRINSDYPTLTPIKVKDQSGEIIEYELLSIPFYLLGQLHRLINSIPKKS